jgi:hypothetical protein
MPNVLVAFSTSDSVAGYVTRRSTDYITIPGGDLYSKVPGKVTFYATAWAYGVEKRDSLPYTMTIARNVVISIESKTPVGSLTPILYFAPQTIVIGTGGVVTWDGSVNFLTDSIDVVFDNPAAVDSAAPYNDPEPYFPYTGRGNIPAIYFDQSAIDNEDYDTYYRKIRAARSFPVAGTYHYHSEIYGSTGTVIVK